MVDERVSALTGWRWGVVRGYDLRFEGVQCVGGPIGIRHLWLPRRRRREGKEGREGGEEEEGNSLEQKTVANGMLQLIMIFLDQNVYGPLRRQVGVRVTLRAWASRASQLDVV